jgi:hypothetical protein
MGKAQLGQDWELIGNDGGDLVFRNKDTGNEQRINKSAALDVDSLTTSDGSNSSLGIRFSGGAGFYVNGSGEIVAVDESGNETTLT